MALNLFPGRLRMQGLHGGDIVSDDEFAAARRVIDASIVSDDRLMTALENAAAVRQLSERVREDNLLAKADAIRARRNG